MVSALLAMLWTERGLALGLVAVLASISLVSAQGPQGIGTGADLLPDPPPSPLRVGLELVTLVGEPVIDITHASDGSERLFLVSPAGKVRIFARGALLPTPFLVDPAWPDFIGMPSIAFHPDYASNGRLYVIRGEALPNASTPHFLPPQELTPTACDSVLYEVQRSARDPNVADLSTKRELLRVRRSTPDHPMNDLAFGGDGYLYVSLGDGGETGKGTPTAYSTNAQDTTLPFGCVLRLDVDQIGPNGRYAIPPDNPFASGADGNLPELYAWGLRNPWRLGTDRVTGAVWTADNGDHTIEEIERLECGKNYGWPIKEGSFLYNAALREAFPDPTPDPAYSNPLAEYDHNNTVKAFGSVIGGTVYRGQRIPSLRGRYVCFDYTAAEFLIVDPATRHLQRLPQEPGPLQLTPFEDITLGDDEAGELYVGLLNGVVLRLVPGTPRMPDRPGLALQPANG